METKKCSKCGEVKENKNLSYCKKCFADYAYFRRTGKHKDVLPEGYKECTLCLKVKKLNCFYPQKGGKHGVKGECKECAKTKRYLYYPHKKKQKYPCIECGKMIYKKNKKCTPCEQKKPKYTELKCDWCNEIKNEKCFSSGSKSTYKNGKKKIYCIECKKKYQKEIDKKYWDEKLKQDFYNKHFDLKNGDDEKFKRYLIRSSHLQHKYMIEIDKESYDLAIELKKEAAILKNKRHCEKRKIRLKNDLKYKKYVNDLSRNRWDKNYIKVLGIPFNLNTAPDELKPAIEGLIILRKKNNFIKEAKNG